MVETEIYERHGSKLASWSGVNIFALWLSTSQPPVTEDVTDLMEKEQQQPGIMKSPSPGYPVLRRAQAFLLHKSKGWEYMFSTSTHMFSEETTPNQKKSQNTETLAGLTCILERFVQLEEWYNTELICMWESQNPHWKNCGKKHKGRGKYPVNVASDKCSWRHCAYNRTAKKSVW